MAFSKPHNVDFIILLGDDVIIHSPWWQSAFENRFLQIAQRQNLPFGAACVSFLDESFKGFPTFPVVHKWHYDALGGTILPSHFDNQGGDPFPFDLYKRFGASEFVLECRLHNTIGGKQSARYTKQRIRFEDDILTTAIRSVREKIADQGRLVQPRLFLDVVIPCYRCDLETLHSIIRLRTTWPAQVSFWIVLDNPSHPNAEAVLNLQTVAHNFQVNVLQQLDTNGNAKNYGASAARNYGLAHSKADYAVMIDDDVTPESHLLDAYLGAIMRWPNASVLVGSTQLPEPHNLLTHAIVASDIPGAYTIAERVREPPWGVTANLCVKARTNRVRFDLRFPKSGGGEDLDFCARSRKHGPIKAVPGARAHHPWWSNGTFRAVSHILGWAEGEVECIGKNALREHVFFTFPNGIETIFLQQILTWTALTLNYCSMTTTAKVIAASIMVFLAELCWHASRIGSHRLRFVKDSASSRMIVRLVAALLIMSQEISRFLRAFAQLPDMVILASRLAFR